MLGFSARDERKRVVDPNGEERETPEGHQIGSKRLTFRARGTCYLASGVGDLKKVVGLTSCRGRSNQPGLSACTATAREMAPSVLESCLLFRTHPTLRRCCTHGEYPGQTADSRRGPAAAPVRGNRCPHQ